MQAIGALTVAGGWTKPVATCNSHGGLESATTNAEIFDSVTEKWSSTGSLNIARAGNNVFGTLLDGRVLYGGGRTPSPADRTVRTQSSEVYDPATATWTRVGDMQSSHTGGHAVTLQNGRVLAVGGGPSFRAAELYTP